MGFRALLESGKPQRKHRVEGVLADADRGVRPYRVEANIRRDAFWGEGGNRCERVVPRRRLRIAAREVPCALIHVHRPYAGIGPFERQGECKGPPSATEVKQVPCRGRGHMIEQDRRAEIEAVGAEDPGRRL